MAQIILVPLIAGEQALAADVMGNFNAIVDLINQGLEHDNLASGSVGTSNLQNGAVTPSKTARINIVTVSSDTTLAAEHLDGCVQVDSSSDVTITVPVIGDLPEGTSVEIYRQGSGKVFIHAASGVTLQSPPDRMDTREITERYASAFLTRRGANTWGVQGTLA